MAQGSAPSSLLLAVARAQLGPAAHLLKASCHQHQKVQIGPKEAASDGIIKGLPLLALRVGVLSSWINPPFDLSAHCARTGNFLQGPKPCESSLPLLQLLDGKNLAVPTAKVQSTTTKGIEKGPVLRSFPCRKEQVAYSVTGKLLGQYVLSELHCAEPNLVGPNESK